MKAKTAGVSDNTIAKVEKIEQQAAPELKPVIAAKAKEKENERKTTFQKSDKPSIDTKKEIAKKFAKRSFSIALTRNIFLINIVLLDNVFFR